MDQLKNKLDDMHIYNDSDFVIESSSDEDEEDDVYSHCVISIDVGIHHLGISVSTLNERFELIEIVWVDLINITNFTHHYGSTKKQCKLHHTKTFCDWLNHVFQEEKDLFDKADFVLIERQPPMGFVVIEQLIFSRFRDKATLISPNSMHKYFHIGGFDYEKRKECTIKIALTKLTNTRLVEQLGYYDRSHDIADSICMTLFWINKKQDEYKDNQRKRRIKENMIDIQKNGRKMTTEQWFENFRYLK